MNYLELGSPAHRKASVSMLLGSIVTFAILYSPQPLIRLFSQQYQVSPATASASISLTTIALGMSLLFFTVVSNIWGRKGIMSLSLLLTSIFAIASAFIHDFQAFLVFRFLEGISIAGFPSIAMTYLNEEFSPRAIGRVIGVYVAGTAIGGFIGRIIIGGLTDLFNWQFAMLMMGIVSLLLSLWFWFYLPASGNFTPSKTSVRQWLAGMRASLADKNLLSMFITGFLLMGGYISVLNYIGYPLTQAPYHVSQTIFGFLFVVNLVGTWSSIWFGKLADRYSRRRVIGLAIAIFILGALMTLSSLLAVKVLGVAVVAFGFFAGHSVASGWVGILAVKDFKAHASSFYLLFYYAGSSLVGWSGGFFLNRFGWDGLVYYTCALLAVSILVSSRVKPQAEKRGLSPS
ncbi:MFS transporter [Paenibacillus elgii]|uniref:MFS transporter n=1 Tax=Paenibacillus elgii TaxID=189691 RepID=UPI002D7DCB46|nr:MFS transporter [Paenibacillus elgii]